MNARFAVPFLALTLAGPVAAAPVDDLYDALALSEIVEIMHEEGLAYGAELGSGTVGKPGNAAWDALVSRIYDTEAMEKTVRAGFDAGLEGVDLAPLLEFFTQPQGRSIVQMEVSARRAMMDPDVEEAARAAFRDAEETGLDRLTLLSEFVQVNDLVESNVVGALNANYQFYSGLAAGGGIEMSEQDILSDVWAQEEDTRADTREWMYAFLLMAYGPLEDETVADYLALSATPEGQALNRALFVGFNTMYDEISYALGLATAREMMAEDL